MKILIIDDDAEDRELLCEAIKEVDDRYKCHAVERCEDGLDWVKSVDDVSYIFLDGKLAGMDSQDCLINLRNYQSLRNTRIIMYSGFQLEEIQRQFLSIGADMFIVKPGTYRELIASLKKVFSSTKEA